MIGPCSANSTLIARTSRTFHAYDFIKLGRTDKVMDGKTKIQDNMNTLVEELKLREWNETGVNTKKMHLN